MNKLSELKSLPLQQGGQIIHFTQDDYGRMLVIDNGKQRILNFDSLFEQSCMQLSHPYQLVHQYTRFMALAVALVEPVHICLFGLGGGSLLRTLHHTLPQCSFHVIELRQAVVATAKDYFSIPTDQRVRITVNDAFNEIANIESNSADIIFSDMYDAYRMAPEQIKRDFLQACARVLTPRGFLVINLHDIPDNRATFFDTLGELFPTILLSATTKNTVLFAGRMQSEWIELNTQRIERMDAQLQQRLSPLLARLRPLSTRMKLRQLKSDVAGESVPQHIHAE